MATLLLRLAGPLQAWGVDSKFETRRTERMPTKSGVLGMVAAALGRRRDADLSDLSALRFGVRVDQEGSLLRDFHTAHSEKSAYVTERWYLENAVFLVGLESGDTTFLEKLRDALKNPVYPLYLGRRSCPPELPLVLDIVPEPLLTALREYPWLAAEWWRKKHPAALLRLTADAEPGESGGLQRDVPISFDPAGRQFGWRKVRTFPPVPVGMTDEHDPMSEL